MNNDFPPFDDDAVDALIPRYAAAIVKYPNDLTQAAVLVSGGNVHHVNWILANLTEDPRVKELVRAGEEKRGPVGLLPTKDELALEVLLEARKFKTAKYPTQEQLKFYELASKIMGFVDKPAINGNNNGNTFNQSVFVVPARTPTSDKGQMNRIIEHQQKLTADVG